MHVQALTDAGFDLPVLVKGASAGTAFSITPQQLHNFTKVPIGSCMKIMHNAEEILQRSR